MAGITLLHAQRVAYVHNPKVASTTILSALYGTAGANLAGRNPRRWVRARAARRELARLGVESRGLPRSDVPGLLRRHGDYLWFTAKRDPLARAVSNYHNKIHRLARVADRRAHYISLLRCLGDGWKALDDVHYRNRHLTALIPMDRFIDLLAQTGIGFDAHFKLQSDLMRMDLIRFDLVLRQEALERDLDTLSRMLAARGVTLARPGGRFNTSDRVAVRTPPSRHFRETVARLYAADCAALGYPLPD